MRTDLQSFVNDFTLILFAIVNSLLKHVGDNSLVYMLVLEVLVIHCIIFFISGAGNSLVVIVCMCWPAIFKHCDTYFTHLLQ